MREETLHLLLRAQDQRLGAEQDQVPCGPINSFWIGLGVLRPVHPMGSPDATLAQGNLLFQLSRDGNVHGSGMSHTTTASPKISLRAPWKFGNAVVGRGNAGWTTSKSGHSCPCQNCSQRPPAVKTGRGSVRNHPSNRSKD